MPAAAPENEVTATIERAMIALQRLQSRRTPGSLQAGMMMSPLYHVLDAVDTGSAGERLVGVREVAEAVRVDQPRASRLVADAVSAGLVRRSADARDGRRSVLVLTDDGAAALADLRHRRRTALDAAMAGWSIDERLAFGRQLREFVARWEREADPRK